MDENKLCPLKEYEISTRNYLIMEELMKNRNMTCHIEPLNCSVVSKNDDFPI